MSKVAIRKVDGGEEKSLPVFEEIKRRFQAVKRRAFDLFVDRGRETGHELDDWLQAEREILGWPAAELAEKNGAYELEITLPGFEAKDVEVTATPDELIIHAAVSEKKQTKREGVVWTEFGSNDVYRRFEVPDPIDLDEVAAWLEKGILHVKAPKASARRAVSAAA